MTTPAKIEPCPFCGADGVIEKPPKGMRGYSSLVGCSNKDCRLGSVAFDSLEEWNRRAHAPKQEWEAKEKALREMCFNLRADGFTCCAYQTDKDYRIAFKIEAILNEGEK